MIIHELFINKSMCNTQELFLGDVPRMSIVKFQIKSCSYTADIFIATKVVNTQLPMSTKLKVV